MTLLDADELDDRDMARHALRLPMDRRLALVTLGAGNINDTSQQTGAVVAALGRLGVEICVTQTEIAASDWTRAGVHVVREFPLSRRFRAFDLAVSASGYNSFHGTLRFGIPTLFIPNRDTALDDQQRRARFASDRGLAHMLGRVSVDATAALLDDLLNRGQAMVANVRSVDRGNGAADAAVYLRELAEAGGLLVREDQLQDVARLARRMPGYRWVRRRAVPRIRRSAAARALAGRMFPRSRRAGQGHRPSRGRPTAGWSRSRTTAGCPTQPCRTDRRYR